MNDSSCVQRNDEAIIDLVDIIREEECSGTDTDGMGCEKIPDNMTTVQASCCISGNPEVTAGSEVSSFISNGDIADVAENAGNDAACKFFSESSSAPVSASDEGCVVELTKLAEPADSAVPSDDAESTSDTLSAKSAESVESSAKETGNGETLHGLLGDDASLLYSEAAESAKSRVLSAMSDSVATAVDMTSTSGCLSDEAPCLGRYPAGGVSEAVEASGTADMTDSEERLITASCVGLDVQDGDGTNDFSEMSKKDTDPVQQGLDSRHGADIEEDTSVKSGRIYEPEAEASQDCTGTVVPVCDESMRTVTEVCAAAAATAALAGAASSIPGGGSGVSAASSAAAFEALADVWRRLADMEGRMGALKEDVAALRMQVEGVNMERTVTLADELELRVSGLESSLFGTCMNAIEASGLSGRLTELETADLDTRLDKLEAEDVSARVGMLEGQQLSARLSALEEKCGAQDALKARLDTLEGVNAGARLDTLESRMDTESCDNRQLTNRLQDIENQQLASRLDVLEAAGTNGDLGTQYGNTPVVEQLGKRMEALEGVDMHGRLDTLDSQLAGVRTDMVAVENRLAVLEGVQATRRLKALEEVWANSEEEISRRIAALENVQVAERLSALEAAVKRMDEAVSVSGLLEKMRPDIERAAARSAAQALREELANLMGRHSS